MNNNPIFRIPTEPLDFVAVQADDELIKALDDGSIASDPTDPVVALLDTWKTDVNTIPFPIIRMRQTLVSRIRSAWGRVWRRASQMVSRG